MNSLQSSFQAFELQITRIKYKNIKQLKNKNFDILYYKFNIRYS